MPLPESAPLHEVASEVARATDGVDLRLTPLDALLRTTRPELDTQGRELAVARSAGNPVGHPDRCSCAGGYEEAS
jgi:hypothetical protein